MNDTSSNDGSPGAAAPAGASRPPAPEAGSPPAGSSGRSGSRILDFARAGDSQYCPSRVHEYVAETVESALLAGEARLIVNLPPRHGKSRLVAVETALWWMVHRPGSEVVVASYGLDLAERHARQAKQRAETRSGGLPPALQAGRRTRGSRSGRSRRDFSEREAG